MIRYFVPSDGDDAEHPNVFQLPSSTVASSNGTLRLGDIAKNFPLPGSYHFRFKKKFRDGFVWVDVTGAESSVPSHDGVYTAKVTRVGDPPQTSVQPNFAGVGASAAGTHHHSSSAAAAAASAAADNNSSNLFGSNSSGTVAGDLLGMSTTPVGASTSTAGSSDLLNMFAAGQRVGAASLVGTATPPPSQANKHLHNSAGLHSSSNNNSSNSINTMASPPTAGRHPSMGVAQGMASPQFPAQFPQQQQQFGSSNQQQQQQHAGRGMNPMMGGGGRQTSSPGMHSSSGMQNMQQQQQSQQQQTAAQKTWQQQQFDHFKM